MVVTGEPVVTLEEVTEPAQWRQFLALPHRLYADDPAWVSPQAFHQRQHF